jgi:hypothetical protein
MGSPTPANDLLADLDTEMRRIAAFLGIGVNHAMWSSLVRLISKKCRSVARR